MCSVCSMVANRRNHRPTLSYCAFFNSATLVCSFLISTIVNPFSLLALGFLIPGPNSIRVCHFNTSVSNWGWSYYIWLSAVELSLRQYKWLASPPYIALVHIHRTTKPTTHAVKLNRSIFISIQHLQILNLGSLYTLGSLRWLRHIFFPSNFTHTQTTYISIHSPNITTLPHYH